MKGLSYQARFGEVSDFFKGMGYVDRSVVFGLNAEGRKNGSGAILFNSEEDASNVIDKLNGEYLGERYLDLTLITYGDYSKFNAHVTGGGGGGNYGGEPRNNYGGADGDFGGESGSTV